ncbi:MAG: ABC transporter substrate-binding protein [Muribaculaceae bacterium]|nr:ABC transporter substrate-binding protein [Muribaculaceae bacterium]
MLQNKYYHIIFGILLFLASCGEGKKSSNLSTLHPVSGFTYAERISMVEHPEGWYEARILNPWDTTRLLQTIVMIPKEVSEFPNNLPQDATIVRIPLEKSLVQSTVHIGLIEELGGVESIKGVADVNFIKSKEIKRRLEEGSVFDCGQWLNPDLEKILQLQPDAIFVSPYQEGGNYGRITELGFPIIYVADYMEMEPLGRAEWIKYYGILFGKAKEADSIFSDVEKKYNHYKQSAIEATQGNRKKKVLFDNPHGESWYVPSSGSYNDNFIRDAGGINPFGYGSLNQFSALNAEKVFAEAHDADIWIIRWNTPFPLSKELLKKKLPIASRFKAFEDNNVWGCNTNESTYYEETPFHPEKVIEDLYHILHTPNPGDSLNFFNRLQ